jgi:hypothetical protein
MAGGRFLSQVEPEQNEGVGAPEEGVMTEEERIDIANQIAASLQANALTEF